MPRTIYALLVGIDKYSAPVPALRGCVNDIMRFHDLLKLRVSKAGDTFQPLLLTDGKATRQGVIDGFRNHLAQAKADDVALFYYSGHGSQAPTAPEFWPIEPDHMDETIVCVDSRTPGKFDLADKELAQLIHEVANKGAHVAILLDCCHSGSGTRVVQSPGVRTRRAPSDTRIRPLESYIVNLEQAEATEPAASRTAEPPASGWFRLPQGKHVVLSACRSDEEAKELFLGGEQRGAFSYYLLDTLRSSNEALTYRELFKRVDALVRGNVNQQSPQIEATLPDEVDLPFLGGAISEGNSFFTVSQDKRLGWVIDGGSVHGIPPVSSDGATLLAVYPFDARPNDLREINLSLGEATVQKVYAGRSKVTIALKDGSQPNPATTYKAVITSLPLPAMTVSLAGDKAALQLIRNALQVASANQGPSLLIKEAKAEKATLRLIAADDNYRIQRSADAYPLAVDTPGFNEQGARLAVQRLEHVARWSTIQELNNPTSRLSPNAVKMELFEIDEKGEPKQLDMTKEIRLSYRQVGDEWKPQPYKVRLTNLSNQPLYAMLIGLTPSFQVYTELLVGGTVLLNPGQSAWAFDGDTIDAQVSDALWQQGATESKDQLKLIVSTDSADVRLLTLESLPVNVVTPKPAPTRVAKNTLERLVIRTGSRDFGRTSSQAETIGDWTTSSVIVTAVRPHEAMYVAPVGRSVELLPGVTLQGHPSLRAEARLISLPQATRDLGNLALPAALRDQPNAVMPFEFNSTRSGEAGVNVLELRNVNDHTLVTPDAPLLLNVALAINENEQILPIGFDGEFYLPIGYANRSTDGVEIRLERLPDPTLVGTRSVGGSIKILFQKLVSQFTPFKTPYPILAIADVADDGMLNYIDQLDYVRRQIARPETQSILLYIHGILGDTVGMALSCRPNARNRLAPDLSKEYDLVLTFDYENLNTRIQDVALSLKERLKEVGLGPDHGKTLHIVAHSMGGLVARWFIEREGGNRVIQKLVMLGTPNGGSPWAQIEDWGLSLLGIGLNSLTGFAWPVEILNGLLGVIESGDISLDQMGPGSEFLKDLGVSEDPAVPYYIIGGNTQLLAAALEISAGETTSPFARLLQKLNRKNILQQVANLAFLQQSNDVAVSTVSVANVPPARIPKPEVHEVASDHMSYFNCKAGLEALVAALQA
ncbi:MAG: caspase family protein [Caldilineaceae bacterium]